MTGDCLGKSLAVCCKLPVWNNAITVAVQDEATHDETAAEVGADLDVAEAAVVDVAGVAAANNLIIPCFLVSLRLRWQRFA